MSHANIEMMIAHTDPRIVHTSLGRKSTYDSPMAAGDLEKVAQDEALESPKEAEVTPGQDVPDKRSGGDSLDVKEDEVQYPSGIRLLFLTFGLMAVVLIVALDNYIIGLLLSITSLP